LRPAVPGLGVVLHLRSGSTTHL